MSPVTAPPHPAEAPRSAVDLLLDRAREQLDRVSPLTAAVLQRTGALVVDIRPHAQRVVEGELLGALVIERNVLEWRFDPTSPARLPEARPDLLVVVLCSEGYTSSLAAAALHEVGVSGATDVVGGFRAWQADGLPTVPGGTPAGQRSGVAGQRADAQVRGPSARRSRTAR